MSYDGYHFEEMHMVVRWWLGALTLLLIFAAAVPHEIYVNEAKVNFILV